MAHTSVLEVFKFYFPFYTKHIKEWFPNGKDSIRVHLDNGVARKIFIFTAADGDTWKLETVNNKNNNTDKE